MSVRVIQDLPVGKLENAVPTAYRAMTTIGMAVESYRSGKVLYFDERNERVTDRPIQVQAKA